MKTSGALITLGMTLGATAAPAETTPVFKHVVIIVQENRTPDNLFGSNPGFEPGVDIASSGKNLSGASIALEPEPLAGCYDISHSHHAFTVMYNGGLMNGANQEDVKSVGGCVIPKNPAYKYVDNSTGVVQPYFDIATNYGFANRMFQTNQGPSFPAHQFLFGATSAPTSKSKLFASENMDVVGRMAGCVAPLGQRVDVINAAGSETASPAVYPCFSHQTMAELLDRAGLSWTYYTNTPVAGSIWDAPVAMIGVCVPKVVNSKRVCTGTAYTSHVTSAQAQVLKDIAACKLPAVTWVIPDAKDSDHAGITLDTGPAWVAGNETYWNDTAIFVTWDDWGGWYDHVPPFQVGGWPTEDWGAGYIYGFRVPLLVVSAYTPAGYVDNANHDFGSLLGFVETNFKLSRIGPGYWADAHGGNLDPFFTLTKPRPFIGIAASVTAAHFLHAERSPQGPDDD